jgi:hypothetical protein
MTEPSIDRPAYNAQRLAKATCRFEFAQLIQLLQYIDHRNAIIESCRDNQELKVTLIQSVNEHIKTILQLS